MIIMMKIECVTFDSSALLFMFTMGSRILDQIINIIESPIIPIIPYPIINELRKLSDSGRPGIAKAARSALDYVLNNFSIAMVEGSPDDSVIEVSRRYGCIAITLDMKLLRRLRSLGIRTIYLRASSNMLEPDFH